MQRISRAPELSATLSLDSCWIIALLRLLQYLDQAPALRLRKRPRLDDPNDVALARLISLVVSVQGAGAAHDLLVSRVAPRRVDPDRDRFLTLVGDHDALSHLGGVGVMYSRRSSGSRSLLSLGGSPLLAPLGGSPLTSLQALGLALLGALRRLGLMGLAGRLEPLLLLPRKIVLRIRLRLRGRLFGRGICRSRLGLRSFLLGAGGVSRVLRRRLVLRLRLLTRGWRRGLSLRRVSRRAVLGDRTRG